MSKYREHFTKIKSTWIIHVIISKLILVKIEKLYALLIRSFHFS